MKSVIIFYSYSGNTRLAAGILADYLKGKGSASLIEIKPKEEARSFFMQSKQAFFKKRVEINEVNLDLSDYDLICFGTPVWAFAPAPAMNTYLDKCTGLENKDIILFSTYGSGTGNARCLDYMQDILNRKGAGGIKRFSVQQLKVKDKEFVIGKVEEIMRLWPKG